MTKILMYHSVGSQASSEAGAELYTVTEDEFREQVRLIAQITPSTSLRAGKSPSHQVTMTFDDGLLDNYTIAFPILKELGLKAYFFVLAGKVGTNGYMNWPQIKEMRDAGMIIGSHGVTHRILTTLSDEELGYELKESKKILETNLNCQIDNFSVGRGFYNQKLIIKAKDTGYKAVFTSDSNSSNGFVLGRIPVKSNWTLEHFKSVLNNGLSYAERLEEVVKTVSKKILGPRVYDKIRTAILSR